MELIPTKYKFKLSKQLSYPFGAKLISEALQTVSQYSKVTLGFSNSPSIRKSTWQALVKSQATIPVLSASYNDQTLDTDEYVFLPIESWHITVYPVPRPRKHDVQEAITKHGFPILVSWLSKKRPESWYHGSKTISFGFDLQANSLRYEAE